MKLLRPNSIVQLLSLGFCLAILPLVVALSNSLSYFQSQSERSQTAITEVVSATRASQQISSVLFDMERTARQYRVLQTPALLEIFNQQAESVVNDLLVLSPLLPDKKSQLIIESLKRELTALNQSLRLPPDDSSDLLDKQFGQLHFLASELNTLREALVDQHITEVSQQTQASRKQLRKTSAWAIPSTITLVVLALLIIMPPMRRLHQSIRRLGEGDMHTAIHVKGPKDIRALGEQLDWLRIRLNQLEQEKQLFLRQMSHELKTPLASLREGADLLADRVPGELSPQQAQVVSLLQHNGMELQKLIENLLNYNLVDAQKQLNLSTFDFRQLLKQICTNHALVAKKKAVRIRVSGPIIEIEAEREKIKTELDNLIGNALSFSPEQSAIRIKWKVTDKGLYIQISDQGPGVAPDEKIKIFDAFYQGSAERKGHVKGSGLGLSVAKESIRMHHGDISLVETDVGACFQIYLPAQCVKSLTK